MGVGRPLCVGNDTMLNPPARASGALVPVLRQVLPAPLLLLGVVAMAYPAAMLGRFAWFEGDPLLNLLPVRGFGLALLVVAAALWLDGRPARAAEPVLAAGAVAVLLLFSVHLDGWRIDDAGITFAYSRSLAEGAGLVAQPGMAPEEAYSSTLWMLILAAAHRLGADIPVAAATIGRTCGAAALLLCLDLVRRRTGSLAATALAFAVVATAPFAVWIGSGQEHALQALLLVLIPWLADRLARWRWPVAAVLTLLVLTRPEAPLIVIAVFAAGLWQSRQTRAPVALAVNLPLAALPFLAFVGLMAFRLAYFGDPMPTPYYAKAGKAGFEGLLNPFGGGTQYLLAGLRDTGLLLLVAMFVPLTKERRWEPAPILLAAAVLLAQVVFIIWAKGDWMGQYRFLMPALPVAALLIGRGAATFVRRRLFCALAALYLLQSTVLELIEFKADPTTPLATVSAIGHGFADVGARLGIDDPLLAHHDAGAIAYDRSIRLVDLGGLLDRQIARHMSDRAFLERYLLVEKRPDFVFGAQNFAIRSGFADGPAFARDYVRLEVVGQPLMRSYLTHVRRDRVVEGPGLEPVTGADGRLEKLIVHPLPPLPETSE
jgi:hypothetical protein